MVTMCYKLVTSIQLIWNYPPTGEIVTQYVTKETCLCDRRHNVLKAAIHSNFVMVKAILPFSGSSL